MSCILAQHCILPKNSQEIPENSQEGTSGRQMLKPALGMWVAVAFEGNWFPGKYIASSLC